jgi:hypothetical protein
MQTGNPHVIEEFEADKSIAPKYKIIVRLLRSTLPRRYINSLPISAITAEGIEYKGVKVKLEPEWVTEHVRNNSDKMKLHGNFFAGKSGKPRGVIAEFSLMLAKSKYDAGEIGIIPGCASSRPTFRTIEDDLEFFNAGHFSK